ncbi:stigma-specific STIG1-like protein 3 [Quercus robur]|uniref:stigma-specific STIG1-like protein 3 n=1 Tax=Quercus robur TaxID=38942 RepID=UPI00216335BA|nr:stigma-specific STIG1-like protein 3 [Quercus robur]
MKSLMLFFVLVNLIALFITLSATTSNNEQFLSEDDETQEAISLRGTSRFLAQKNARVVMTCDKYPRVCHAKGSPGRDCCKKKCVNVLTDRLNCGKCGKKCKYSEICCKAMLKVKDEKPTSNQSGSTSCAAG